MIDHPDLDKLMEKHLPKTNLRPARDIVDNIRIKVIKFFDAWMKLT